MTENLLARALVAQFLTELLERVSDEPLQHLITGDFRLHLGAGEEEARGVAALRPLLDGMAALGDTRLGIEDLLAEGDRVAARFVVDAGRPGPAAPARLRLPGLLLARVRHGKVAEAWLEQNRLARLPQVGSEPAVARAG